MFSSIYPLIATKIWSNQVNNVRATSVLPVPKAPQALHLRAPCYKSTTGKPTNRFLFSISFDPPSPAPTVKTYPQTHHHVHQKS